MTMTGLTEALRQEWRRSRSFRLWTILAVIGLVINLALTVLWQMGFFSVENLPPVNDLKIYLEAGNRFSQRENLYIAPRPDLALYAYSPAFALVLGFLAFLPYKALWSVDAVLHIIVYWAIYRRWFTIFHRQGLNSSAQALIRLFPLWIIFTGLLYEIAYMNIYIFMAFIATLLLEAILAQQTGKTILWLAILLPIKPQWAFALGIPLLLGQWRFLIKVAAGAIVAYLAILTITVLIAGPYALQQYQEYIQFLVSIPRTFVWRTMTNDGYPGYNHSIMQFVIFFTNRTPYSVQLVTVIKILLSLPLLGIYWRYRRHAPHEESSGFILEWAFALYLLAFLWLDVVTELTFGIVIFTYLWGTLSRQSLKTLAGFVFLPYALNLAWVTVSTIMSLAIPLPDVIMDPGRFVPFILIATLGLYLLTVWRLNDRLRGQKSTETEIRSSVSQPA